MFATESEAAFAAILDYHDLDWEYEKKTFILSEDENGATLRAFTPDFYVPKWDAYVEITMMRSDTCTRKNRKIADTEAMYPVKVFLMKKTDMEKLLEKYKFLFYSCEVEESVL